MSGESRLFETREYYLEVKMEQVRQRLMYLEVKMQQLKNGCSILRI